MKRVSLPVMTDRLGEERVERFWRSLEELAHGPPAPVRHEGMPEVPRELDDPSGRRQFMKLMGASLALAGAGCSTSQPPETIVPYVKKPEEIVPGIPLFYATAVPLGGVGTGALVETHMARPIKVEGNPQHPGSLGATDVFMQASVLDLYNPDRSKAVTYIGDVRSWSSFVGAMGEVLTAARGSGGRGLRVLTEATTSPTLIAQMNALLKALPNARWHRYEPSSRRSSAIAASNTVFGAEVNTLHRFDQADVVVALDADFLSPTDGNVRYARDFMSRHRAPDRDGRPMSRLYVAESAPSLTGSRADHRVPVRASEIERIARAIAARLGVNVGGDTTLPPGVDPKWLDALTAALGAARGAGLVVAGSYQTPAVHAIAHLINGALGAVGTTVVYTDPITPPGPEGVESLADLARAMDAGEVDTLFLLGGNPVFTAPADLRFAERMQKVRLRVHLGLYLDETAALSHWHIPEAHFLEAWSDIRGYDGTTTILQPMILPLYGGKSIHEIVALLTGQAEAQGYDLVRGTWQAVFPKDQFEAAWRSALHDGVVPNTAAAVRNVTAKPAPIPETPLPQGTSELVFRPDYSIYDGRFYTNAWLQECPRPMTKLVWDNAVWVSPATAKRLGVDTEDVVELAIEGRSVRAPVVVVPGHPDDSFLVHLGYGRAGLGAVGGTHGFDAYRLRSSAAPWVIRGVEVKKTGAKYPLVTTQGHHTMAGRNLILTAPVHVYSEDPKVFEELAEVPPRDMSLYPEWRYPSYAWGMSIDTSACIGCNACVVACQAENNIPVVGKEQVGNGREMLWLRVDRYFEGTPENPKILWEPIPCMHCEQAPCEVVCPVTATVHHEEGMNDMVYNRCVGTRYCSNNCPYKVRRFNFFNYNEDLAASLRLRENPDVTVRSRGVMEKCTYCVQRINYARIHAQNENRRIRDGEVQTACQAACPTGAIVFGDINDKGSAVRKLKDLPRNYPLLAELNTRPRTTYLATITNPNPTLAPKARPEGSRGPGHGTGAGHEAGAPHGMTPEEGGQK